MTCSFQRFPVEISVSCVLAEGFNDRATDGRTFALCWQRANSLVSSTSNPWSRQSRYHGAASVSEVIPFFAQICRDMSLPVG